MPKLRVERSIGHGTAEGKARSPQDLRLPQPDQPASPSPIRHHPGHPTSSTYRHQQKITKRDHATTRPRPTAKNPMTAVYVWTSEVMKIALDGRSLSAHLPKTPGGVDVYRLTDEWLRCSE